mmetsp:Transcript_76609/g.229894  ORF Transcript_76609/g.229894 Transcript_76609/m.229894 type:complete len:424 (+) Transcript_76609:64-1335(+)
MDDAAAASAWARHLSSSLTPIARIGCLHRGFCHWTGPLALRVEVLLLAAPIAVLLLCNYVGYARCRTAVGRVATLVVVAAWCAWAATDIYQHRLPPGAAATEGTASHVQLVISSCNSNLSWTSALPPALLRDVVVLEKCGHFSRGDTMATRKRNPKPGVGQMLQGSAADPHTAARPAGFLYLGIQPNNGREAMAYLWYITHGWDSLRAYTVFLQGDADRHSPMAERPGALAELILRYVGAGAAFSSLGNCCIASHHAHPRGWSMWLECEIYRNFTRAAGACYPWVGAPFATFLVRRDAIRQHDWSTFHNLLRLFTEPASHPKLQLSVDGHSDPYFTLGAILERAWSLIFGCSRPLLRGLPAANCSFEPHTAPMELKRRCSHAFRTISGGTGPLVRGEHRADVCLGVHGMAEQLRIEERGRHTL